MTYIQKAIRFASALALLGSLPGIFGACAEPAGSGTSVTIPNISVICATARCRSSGSGTAYVTYTTSSCSNPAFGETASGSASVTCLVGGCSGTVAGFVNSAGATVLTIREGTYSICVTIDFNGNYGGTAVTGDSTGAQSATLSTGSTGSISVTSFTDL